jgi:hypothetical protein
MDEIDRIRACARHSVGRAFLFALLAIATVVAGLIAWPATAFRCGAILYMLAAAIMLLKARGAPRRPYRRTETWVLLGKRTALAEPGVQATIGAILAEIYGQFAQLCALVSAALWLGVFAARAAGAAA